MLNPSDDRRDVWSKLAAPLDPKDISWRIDSKPTQKNGKYFARFVCLVESNTIRSRLDSVVPGEWDCTLELLPERPDSEGALMPAFKARLQVLGVIRENVGTGKDVKIAATDAFKRAAVHFGIGSELYDFEQNWVEVDGDSKNAKPVEDPQAAYERRYGKGAAQSGGSGSGSYPNTAPAASASTPAPTTGDAPACPKCRGRMWDNRLTKKNPRQPDYKCRDKTCDGVIWPPKDGGNAPARSTAMDPQDYDETEYQRQVVEDDGLPF